MIRLDHLPAELLELRAGGSTDERIEIGIEDCRIAVASNSAPLLAELRRHFGETPFGTGEPDLLVAAVEAPAARLDCHFVRIIPEADFRFVQDEYADFRDGRVVRKRRSGNVFLFNESVHLAVGPVTEHPGEVIRFIRRDPRLSSVPILAVSSDTQDAIVAGILSAGADAFLPKPVEFDDLEKIVEKITQT